MAETVMPAVRGVAKFTITALQVVVGSLGGVIAGAAAAFVIRSVVLRPSATTIVVACAATGFADLANRRWGHPGPLALNRQVPRSWGHEHGPWLAAVRYSFRMGVGPATILTTWIWWAGLLLCGTAGFRWSVAGAVVFSLTRFAAAGVSAAGIADGVAMARRSRRLDTLAPLVNRFALLTPWAVICASLAIGAGS